MEKKLPISQQRAYQNQVMSLAHTKKLILSHEKGQIIIRSADTYVLVLVLYYY